MGETETLQAGRGSGRPVDPAWPGGDGVKLALALGWQMARLYESPVGEQADPKLKDDLPGLSELPSRARLKLGVEQADVALAELAVVLDTRASLPSTDELKAELAKQPADRDATRQAILDLHVDLLVRLTAADFRLGKAYGLGRALADTCRSPDGTPAQRRKSLVHRLEPGRLRQLSGWLDDLKTVLPAHGAHAVCDSIERWRTWAESERLVELDAVRLARTSRTLHRCGQRWRALLSGEKDARDLLEISDYVSAARGTLTDAGRIARSMLWQMRIPLVLATALIVAGLALMFLNRSSAQVIAGLGTVAGGLGVTWRSTSAWLGRVSLDLVDPLWEAQLDRVLGNILTPAPQRDCVPELQRPLGRWRRAWRELRAADPNAPGGVPAPGQTTRTAEQSGDTQDPPAARTDQHAAEAPGSPGESDG